MKLSILASSSKGNGYVLHNNTEALIIEAGVKFREVQKALDFKSNIIVGCIISHEHGDHSKYIKEYLGNSVKVYASKGTINSLSLRFDFGLVKPVEITSKRVFKTGNFIIMPFDVQHDAAQPFGFIINHPESGNILFLTDSYYSKYTFKNLNNVIIEANYVSEVLQDAFNNGKLEPFRYNRTLTSHMSLENCKKLLLSNDITEVNNIVLIHLSDSHSNAERAFNEISEATGKSVTVAKPGINILFNKYAF